LIRKALSVTGLIAVTFAGLAAAAVLVVNAGSLQAGAEQDLVCDEDGVNVEFHENDAGLLKKATISDIDEDCIGASLKFDTAADEGGPFFVGAINSSSLSFRFSSPQEPDAVNPFDIAIFGPDGEAPNQGD
jgi:hypothetical protein